MKITIYSFLISLLASFPNSAFVVKGEGAITVCTENSATYWRKNAANIGKIWADLYPTDHKCLEILGQNNLWRLINAYASIEKNSPEQLTVRQHYLLRIELEAEEALQKAPKNQEELLYINDRAAAKAHHLDKLQSFLNSDPETLVQATSPEHKAMEERYHSEFVFQLDPGLRHDGMSNAWKKWGAETKTRKTLKTLKKFYLWLEAQHPTRFDFPLAPQAYRDKSVIEVIKTEGTFATELYGSFDGLKNISTESIDEDGATNFLYVVSPKEKLYIFQDNDLPVHSLALHGRPVIAAGMLTIKDGKINYLDNASGHYKPNDENLFRGLIAIRKNYGDAIFSDPLKIESHSRKRADQLRAINGGQELKDSDRHREVRQ